MAVTERPLNTRQAANTEENIENGDFLWNVKFKDGCVKEVPFSQLQDFLGEHWDELVITQLPVPILC